MLLFIKLMAHTDTTRNKIKNNNRKLMAQKSVIKEFLLICLWITKKVFYVLTVYDLLYFVSML